LAWKIAVTPINAKSKIAFTLPQKINPKKVFFPKKYIHTNTTDISFSRSFDNQSKREKKYEVDCQSEIF